MCEQVVEDLLRELEESEVAFALKYLEFRDTEVTRGRFLSVDDARANAVLWLNKQHKPLPEVLRYRLHRALGIERSVEP